MNAESNISNRMQVATIIKNHYSALVFFSSLACAGSSLAIDMPANPPSIAPFGDGEMWVLTKSLSYRIGTSQDKIIIPRGFVTDLASVPPIFWSVLPKTGKYMSAAILHDFLYADQRCSKEEADTILKVEMDIFGVPELQRLSIFKAVDKFGWNAWIENSKLHKLGAVRVLPPNELDKFLSEELDASKSWQAVKKGIKQEKVNGYTFSTSEGNDSIKSICTRALNANKEKRVTSHFSTKDLHKRTSTLEHAAQQDGMHTFSYGMEVRICQEILRKGSMTFMTKSKPLQPKRHLQSLIDPQ